MERRLLLLLCLAISLMADAQNYPPPTGVYCSCAPTRATGTGSVDPAIASQPFVKGILVRIGWDLLEPTDNQYNWALLDTQIVRARSYGKKVTLAVVNGPAAPQWLYTTGAQFTVIAMPNNDTVPYPWDSTYLAQWDEMVTALGNRYDGDTSISLVHITHATANGFEFFLHPTNQFNWNNVGYTDSLIIQSWKQVIHSFAQAFPSHYLDNDYHPIFLSSSSSSLPADSVYAYAKQTVGSRYGAFSSWWTQNNTATYANQYTDLLDAADNTFAAVQMANNGTTDSAAFGPGGLAGALSLAINDGICYWEVWNQDILNPDFATMLSDAKCAETPSGIGLYTEPDIKLNIYPNPLTETATINLTGCPANKTYSLTIINVQGKTVKRLDNIQEGLTPIDGQGLSRGIYFYLLHTGGQVASQGKLVVQ